MNIPILIVHKGNTFYLPIVLRQLRLFNPNSRICLISDESTKCYDFVEHYDIKKFISIDHLIHMIMSSFVFKGGLSLTTLLKKMACRIFCVWILMCCSIVMLMMSLIII